jgi:ribokinase
VAQVVVVGSVNADYVVRVGHLPRPGETVTGGRLEIHPGGKGANQAHAAARLGGSVALFAAVGRDSAAESERAALAGDGVDTSGLVQLDGPSGLAAILVDEHGENMIAVAPGANALLSPELVADRLPGLLRDGGLVLASLEIPVAAVAAAATAAAAAGAAMVINPAPGRRLPAALLRAAVLTPNEGELARLAPDAPDPETAVAGLFEVGARAVMVTRGSRGATLYRPGTPPLSRPAPPVRVVDTVGAGDAFNGALAVALANGGTLDDALDRAVAAGALACTGPGARAALPTAAEVDDLLRAGRTAQS